ncbi:MAG: glycosyltransferase family 2 protein [Betaproteobacteria bacterium]|nr:MAG: glycosyltransferase family 2 protein [Betaproteobacteria bacterium]
MSYQAVCPPVLVLAFNRPCTTAKVLEAIRSARPPRLFFAVDGPRSYRSGERDSVFAVQKLVDAIDWSCQVETLFRSSNLGCKIAVSEAISWFFDQVEQGIVLEDDCVADPSFFKFAAELLNHFQSDRRVCMLSGDNFQLGTQRTPYSYYASRFTHIWGWATWRRAWQLYDHSMSRWPELRKTEWLERYLQDRGAARYWRRAFDDTYADRNSSWAYRWTYSAWVNDALTLIPESNLVSNIGFGEGATHNLYKKNRFAALPTEPISFPLRHPPEIERNAEADEFTQATMFRNLPLWRRVGGRTVRALRELFG